MALRNRHEQPPCDKKVTAIFPCGVNAPVQYGEVIKSWAIYFQQQQFIPEDRLQETFSDLFGVKLATATLNGFSESVYDGLSDFDSEVLSKIKIEPVKHLDETGFRENAETLGFTNRYGCKNLVYYEQHEDMLGAISREKQKKAGSRKKKIALIESTNLEWQDLYKTLL